MKYKELERQIQNLNIAYEKQLKISNNGQLVDIYDDNYRYAAITNNTPYCMQVWEESFTSLEDDLRHDLLKALYEFAQTPINLRNLFQKFYISSKLTPDDNCSFLFKDCGDIDDLGWGYKDGENVEFTQKEIDYICDKFHTNLSDFNIEEVEK